MLWTRLHNAPSIDENSNIESHRHMESGRMSQIAGKTRVDPSEATAQAINVSGRGALLLGLLGASVVRKVVLSHIPGTCMDTY